MIVRPRTIQLIFNWVVCTDAQYYDALRSYSSCCKWCIQACEETCEWTPWLGKALIRGRADHSAAVVTYLQLTIFLHVAKLVSVFSFHVFTSSPERHVPPVTLNFDRMTLTWDCKLNLDIVKLNKLDKYLRHRSKVILFDSYCANTHILHYWTTKRSIKYHGLADCVSNFVSVRARTPAWCSCILSLSSL